MNFGSLGSAELIIVLGVGFVLCVVPILVAVWVLVVVYRMRRRIEELTMRVNALAAAAMPPR